MSDDVRKNVAKALFRADDMVAKPDFAWGETTAASYDAMADAAIAAHLEALGGGGYVVVKLPKLEANARDRYEIEGAGLQFKFTDDEFHLWVWNSVSGSTLQKRFDRSVGTELAVGLFAAAAEALDTETP